MYSVLGREIYERQVQFADELESKQPYRVYYGVGILSTSLSSAMPHSVRSTWFIPHRTIDVRVRSEYYN
jgi:hypothetical protein